jgi:acyl-CoA dehydrogenase
MAKGNEKMKRFASEHIAGRNLNEGLFPSDLWEMMCSDGLLDPLTGYFEISSAGEALVRYGGNIGIALSWMLHQLTCRFVFDRLGTLEQKAILAGGKTACLAMSEPKTGAHPKHMKTRAELSGDSYSITGEKAYITNAPIADLFVVIAVTGEKEGRKEFSALIVPESSEGLKVADMDLPFLRPSPHGTVKIDTCAVPEENLIGTKGKAYDEIVLPFREVEDVMMMGPLAGAMGFIMDGIVKISRHTEINDEVLLMLGRMKAITGAAAFIARKTAAALDENIENKLLSVILVSRTMAAEFQELAGKLISGNAAGDEKLSIMLDDFGKMIRIADGVSKIKQKRLGETLLRQNGD